jgi:formyltetrahydrofolate synthetase
MKNICLVVISALALFGCSHRTSNDVHYTPGSQYDQSKSQTAEQQKAPPQTTPVKTNADDSQSASVPNKKADIAPSPVQESSLRSCALSDVVLINQIVGDMLENIKAMNREVASAKTSMSFGDTLDAQEHMKTAREDVSKVIESCQSFGKIVDVANCTIGSVKEIADKFHCGTDILLRDKIDEAIERLNH